MNLYVYIHTCKCFISCNIFSSFVIQCHLVFVNKNNTVLRNACFWLVNKHKGFCVFVGLKWKNDWLLKRDGDYWNGWDTFWYHCNVVWHERHVTDEGERTVLQILKLCQRSGGCAGILRGSRSLHCSQESRVITPVGSTRGASAVKGQHSCGGCWVCIDSPGLAPLWGQKRVAMAVWGQHKLQALVYDILPSTTAVFRCTIESRKLSANEQFFVGGQTVVSLLQTTQMKQGVSFIAANKVYTSTNKTTIVWIETELFFFFFYLGWMRLMFMCVLWH